MEAEEIARGLIENRHDSIERGEYVRATIQVRKRVRELIAARITELLVDGYQEDPHTLTKGLPDDLVEGAIRAENIGNSIWHLMVEARDEDDALGSD